MNLYSNKLRWKILLVFMAAIIVGLSLWYTGTVVEKIKSEEKRKVEQWAEEVKGKIEQANVRDSLLMQQKLALELLTEGEKQKARDWASYMNELSRPYEDYSFFMQKIQSNDNIPLILVDHESRPSEVRNLGFDEGSLADDELAERFREQFSGIRRSLSRFVRYSNRDAVAVDSSFIDSLPDGTTVFVFKASRTDTSYRIVHAGADSVYTLLNTPWMTNTCLLIPVDTGSGAMELEDAGQSEMMAALWPELKMESEAKAKEIYQDTLGKLILAWSMINPPIQIDYIGNQKFKVYYSYSKEVDRLERESKALTAKSDSIYHDFNERLNKSIRIFPMLYVNAQSGEIISTNLSKEFTGNQKKLKAKMAEMEQESGKIPVKIAGEVKGYIYYQNSDLVKQLSYYPYIQFGIIGLFLLVGYFLFSSFRKAEQNQVWVGMAKETAHQLGTPISSLMAWTELLKSQGVDDNVIVEINKDLARLDTVTDRFSKIGSGGKLEKSTILPVLQRVYDYLEKRVSKKLEITVSGDGSLEAMANVPLLEWVIENLSKNGVDAMEGEGKLSAEVSGSDKEVYIDISDTGKGIPQSKFKTVFEPGFTTKKRGWGLGLSLVKRIVEEYHEGRVYVLKSEAGKGTTFRVVLKKA